MLFKNGCRIKDLMMDAFVLQSLPDEDEKNSFVIKMITDVDPERYNSRVAVGIEIHAKGLRLISNGKYATINGIEYGSQEQYKSDTMSFKYAAEDNIRVEMFGIVAHITVGMINIRVAPYYANKVGRGLITFVTPFSTVIQFNKGGIAFT